MDMWETKRGTMFADLVPMHLRGMEKTLEKIAEKMDSGKFLEFTEVSLDGAST